MGFVGLMGLVGLFGLVGLVHLVSLFGLVGWSAYFLAILSDPKVSLNGNIVFDDAKEFDDPQVVDGLKVISNESQKYGI